MATNTLSAVFADFNEPREEATPAPVDDVPSSAGDIGQIREEAWTDGYLTGRQERAMARADQTLTATLLTSVHELDSKASGAVEAASLAVADLLVNTVIAVASDDWSARLLDRVRMVADRIKPALTVTPEFVLRDHLGIEQRFGDITELSRAMDGGVAGEDVSIRWQHGEATISRTALLEDLREAIIPLSAGRTNEQNAGQHT